MIDTSVIVILASLVITVKLIKGNPVVRDELAMVTDVFGGQISSRK